MTTSAHITGVAASLSAGTLATTTNIFLMTELLITVPASLNAVSLRWSDDAGCTWSNQIVQSIGDMGEYDCNVQFRRLGLARNRVFELSYATHDPIPLTGAWVVVEVLAT